MHAIAKAITLLMNDDLKTKTLNRDKNKKIQKMLEAKA